MSKRRNYDAAFKARVALGALKGERTASELTTAHEVHPTMIHQWNKALPEGAAGIFKRGGKVAAAAGIAEDTVRETMPKGMMSEPIPSSRSGRNVSCCRSCGRHSITPPKARPR